VLLLGVAQKKVNDPAAAATLQRFLLLDPANPAVSQVRALLGTP